MAGTRQILLLLRQTPRRGGLARESLELAVVTAVFDQSVSVLFKDDGVWQLLGDGADDEDGLLAELGNYGVNQLYACGPSLEARGLRDSALAVPVRRLTLAEQHALLASQHVVLSD